MFNNGTVKKTTGAAPVQILATTEGMLSVGIVVAKELAVASGNGKVIKAGMPLAGDLTARTTKFTEANADGSDVVGILLHDIPCNDNKDVNGTLLLAGMVNVDRIDSTTAGKLVAAVKKALPTIKFIK